MSKRRKLVRLTTVPMSLNLLLSHQLRFMNDFYEVVAISSPGDELSEVGKREQVRTIGVAMTRAITPLKDIQALWKLYRVFRKESPAIVHTHTPKAGLLGMMAANLAGVPIRMHTVAGMPLLEATGVKRQILNIVERITYKCASRVYPNSANLKQIIVESGLCESGKLKVIGRGSSNGIDTGFFSPEQISGSERDALRKELGISPSDTVFCFVGRVVGDKGVNELLNAFDAISQSYNHVKLIVVGPLEEELDAISDRSKVILKEHPKVKWVGYQRNVRIFLSVSQVLVFPSYREGFPNVPMQAGSMQLPCIVTDINGSNEIIVQMENGIIVPVKDSTALENAMRLLLTDENLRFSLAKKSREMIVRRYEQRYVWEELLKEYKLLEATMIA